MQLAEFSRGISTFGAIFVNVATSVAIATSSLEYL